jgi:hypothetical protein
MVTLVGCANSYTLLFLCPVIYLDYFWCIKYQHINIYMKMGKKWEKKKEKGFLASWAGGGGVIFGPAKGERARWRGRRPTKERRSAGPCVSERRGLTARVVLRWDLGFATGKWWQGMGGGRGSRGWGQFDRRRPRVAGPWRGGGRSRR